MRLGMIPSGIFGALFAMPVGIAARIIWEAKIHGKPLVNKVRKKDRVGNGPFYFGELFVWAAGMVHIALGHPFFRK